MRRHVDEQEALFQWRIDPKVFPLLREIDALLSIAGQGIAIERADEATMCSCFTLDQMLLVSN